MLIQLTILCVCSAIVLSQKLPTAFTGVVQGEKIAKKGEEHHTAPHAPLLEGCYNQHECCQTLSTLGHCIHHRADLKLWCPQSCGFCEPNYDSKIECSDRHQDCERMAKAGLCNRFEYFMSENCRATCGKCKKTRAQICPGARMDCSKAPTQAIRLYCEQLQRWDEGARKSTILGPEVALPPGSHSIADLAN